MGRFKFDSEALKLMDFFESMSGARIKDCVSNDKILLVVEENDMGKAIGKNGINIKKFEGKIKKKVKLAEFSGEVSQFVKNLSYPAEILEVKNEEGIVTIHGKDANTRAMLIGRNRQNLIHLTGIVKRHFDVKEIRVV